MTSPFKPMHAHKQAHTRTCTQASAHAHVHTSITQLPILERAIILPTLPDPPFLPPSQWINHNYSKPYLPQTIAIDLSNHISQPQSLSQPYYL